MLKEGLDLNGKTVLVTGAAGFVGANLVLKLLQTYEDICVVGLDSVNDYYDPALKEYRLSLIEEEALASQTAEWVFARGNLADKGFVQAVFEEYRPSVVVNLAAQAGVRYSITNPEKNNWSSLYASNVTSWDSIFANLVATYAK